MGIDASIPLRVQNIQLDSPADVMTKAMTMKQLSRQSKMQDAQMAEEKTMKDLFTKNTVTDEKGQASINKKAFLSDMMKVNPEKAIDYEKVFANRDLEDMQRQVKTASMLASSATPENWSAIRAKAQEMGLNNADKLPETYSEGFVRNWLVSTMDGEKQIEHRLKEKNFGLKERQVSAQERALHHKTANGAQMKLTKGQETVDREFGKEYSEWTSGSDEVAQTEINKLRSVAARLKKKDVTTGGMTGMLHDRVTSTSVLSARADVSSTIMNSLRVILGAAFTEKEGQQVINNTWNEADSTANNLARVERLAGDLEAKAKAKTEKAQHYEQHGTLSNYRSQGVAGRRENPRREGGRVKQVANELPLNLRNAPDEDIDALFLELGGKL